MIYARLQRFLSELLECDVDLATPDALHKDLKDNILKEAIHAAWEGVETKNFRYPKRPSTIGTFAAKASRIKRVNSVFL